MRATMTSGFIVLLMACAVSSVYGQESPYVGLEERPIKALSQDQIGEYLQGHGMGMALAAELNGYPGPKHVLELASDLDLAPSQVQQIQEIFDAMHVEAVALGEQIVELERVLDDLFRAGKIDDVSLERSLADLSVAQGELRRVHLAAHLKTRALLSPDQIDRYSRARGYDSEHHTMSGHHSQEHGP